MTLTLVAGVVLAHHALLPAVPFLVPALVMTLTVLAMIIQDRRRPPDPPPDHPDMETYRV